MLYHKSEVSKAVDHFRDQPTENNFIQSNEYPSALYSEPNFVYIWYHDDDLNKDVQCEMRNRLKELFTDVHIINDPCKFAAYLHNSLVKKMFFIITSNLAEYLCIIARNRPQCQKVYQFQPTTSSDNSSVVFADINKLIRKISEDMKPYLNNQQSSSSASESLSAGRRESIVPPPWSIWNPKLTENSFRYGKKESPEFFLFQILTTILTKIECDHDRSLEEMISQCRLYYISDPVEVRKIDDVKNNYQANEAVSYYTRDSFLFRLLGRAFRSEDFEQIFIFRRYIIDLHWELDKLIKEQQTIEEIPKFYRGKKLRTTVLEQLKSSVGGLVSMNGFLSTTCNRDIALKVFAGVEQNPNDSESVLFEVCVDKAAMSRAYAFISAVSQYPEEEEVLFTIGSIWRIDSVEKNNNSYWIVKLSSCNHDNSPINQFFKELTDDSTFLMLGDILLELGEHTKAKKFYDKMLEEPTTKYETRATLYYNIAMINIKHGDDSAALENLKEAEKLLPMKLINTEPFILQLMPSSSIVPSSLHIFNNMGCLYKKKNEPKNALIYFTKALNVVGSDQIDKATVYDNIGLLYYSDGDYQTAFEHLSKAVKLAQDHSSLPKFKQHYDAVYKHLSPNSNVFKKKLDDSN